VGKIAEKAVKNALLQTVFLAILPTGISILNVGLSVQKISSNNAHLYRNCVDDWFLSHDPATPGKNTDVIWQTKI